MRTIKFRAKAHRVNGDIWIYGDLRHRNGDVCIFKQEGNCGEQVNRDTIGQFTGLLDKNGREIYEGDIIRFVNGQKKVNGEWVDNEFVYTVEYSEGRFYGISGLSKVLNSVEVIGNIHDNPELITFKIDTHKEDEE